MESTRDVAPLRPVAPYIGGKRHLAERIVARIEAIPHAQYAEPFVGMGGVFLRRRRAPRVEIINDFNRDIATFFRVLQRHYVAFVEMMRFQLTTRAEFERLAASNPDTLTDLERAARFLYLQRLAFGGKVTGRTFGVGVSNPARFNITRLEGMLEELHSRLAGVTIECLDFREFITRYDDPATLFYIDPPYFGSEFYYGKSAFERADFHALARLLEGIAGRFVLSINDVPEIRGLFGAFDLQPVETRYTVHREGELAPAKELIITDALSAGDANAGEFNF